MAGNSQLRVRSMSMIRAGPAPMVPAMFGTWFGPAYAADDHTIAGTGIGCEAAEAAPGADRA